MGYSSPAIPPIKIPPRGRREKTPKYGWNMEMLAAISPQYAKLPADVISG